MFNLKDATKSHERIFSKTQMILYHQFSILVKYLNVYYTVIELTSTGKLETTQYKKIILYHYKVGNTYTRTVL